VRKRVLFVGVLVLVLASVPVLVWAAGKRDLATIRAASSQYHRFEVAEADGWIKIPIPQPDGSVLELGCIEHPTEGAMGTHYILPERFDADLNLEEPEVLLYVERPNGELRLVGVEYVIPAAAWASDDPPEFLGQQLKYKTTVGTTPVDPYWEVHAWVWYNNPSGVFADWNPRISCPPAE
jgi:hypothetical protein